MYCGLVVGLLKLWAVPVADCIMEAVLLELDCLVCMGSLYHCIVACAYLGNGTGCRTAIMTAPLLLTIGPVRYKAVLHSCRTSPVGGRVPPCDNVHL